MSGLNQSTANSRKNGEPTRACKRILVAALLVLPGLSSAQDTPMWVSATPVISTDGFATLQWTVNGDQSVAVFRILEQTPADRQYIFTDQAEIRLFRNVPGDYSYWVQACAGWSSDQPRCGPPSQPLTLTVQMSALTHPPAAEHAVKAAEASTTVEMIPAQTTKKSKRHVFSNPSRNRQIAGGTHHEP